MASEMAVCTLTAAASDSSFACVLASLTSHLAKSLVVARSGTRRAASSLAAVNPTVAPNLSTEEKGVAPEFSRLRRMMAAERPDPDLKFRYLLASAAPASDGDSEVAPALG